MSLWILASKHDNSIPDRGAGLERHNLSHEAFDLPLLVREGFLEPCAQNTGLSPANGNASNALSPPSETVPGEVEEGSASKMLSLARSQESETETEGEGEKSITPGEENKRPWYRRPA